MKEYVAYEDLEQHVKEAAKRSAREMVDFEELDKEYITGDIELAIDRFGYGVSFESYLYNRMERTFENIFVKFSLAYDDQEMISVTDRLLSKEQRELFDTLRMRGDISYQVSASLHKDQLFRAEPSDVVVDVKFKMKKHNLFLPDEGSTGPTPFEVYQAQKIEESKTMIRYLKEKMIAELKDKVLPIAIFKMKESALYLQGDTCMIDDAKEENLLFTKEGEAVVKKAQLV